MSAATNDTQRKSLFRIPSLFEIFFGRLANWIRQLVKWRKQGLLKRALQERQRRTMRMEVLEPRLLLSADLNYIGVAPTGTDLTLVATSNTQLELRLTSNASMVASGTLGSDGVVNILRSNGSTDAALQAAAADTLRLDFNSLSMLSFGGSVFDINFKGGAQDIQRDHVIVQGDTSSSPLTYSVGVHADADIDLPSATKLDLASLKDLTLASLATRTVYAKT